jgi:hypothetical protein
MWNHLLPKDSCIVCGRKCYEANSRKCTGADILLCDKWIDSNRNDIVKQQIKNLEERLRVDLPPLDELRMVNRRGLYLGDGEYVYHPKTDTFFRCMVKGNIPLLLSELWTNVNKSFISCYHSQYNAELKDILKKRLFEENNEGEWPPEKQIEVKASSEEYTDIEYENMSGFNEAGPFAMKYATAASY